MIVKLFGDLDFGPNVEIFDRFEVDTTIPVQEQFDCLDQDMFQAVYESGYVIDVGWYEAAEPISTFAIYVVNDQDWDEPLMVIRCRDLDVLKEAVKFCIDFVNRRTRPW